MVAWAKRRGLEVVEPALRGLVARGGRAALLVGIDLGGASRQGLELALDLFDPVYVVHDEPTGAAPTFHPKVFLACGEERARAFVGSNNLTGGGLQANYEAALDVDLDLRDAGDRQLCEQIQRYVSRLIADTGVCRNLDGGVLAELAAEPRYRIIDEDSPEIPDECDEAARSDGAGTRPTAGRRLFGDSLERKRGFPPAGRRSRGAARGRIGRGGAADDAPPPTTAATPVRIVRRWFKRLPRADAQRPDSPGTNVTGALRLTQARLPIDQRTYFRDVFFRGLPWGPDTRPSRRGPGEFVELSFIVQFDGAPARMARLRVVHDPRRVAGQNNFATSIHWGELMPELAARNYTGDYVTIERMADDTFRLSVGPVPSGPFL